MRRRWEENFGRFTPLVASSVNPTLVDVIEKKVGHQRSNAPNSSKRRTGPAGPWLESSRSTMRCSAAGSEA